MIARKYLMALVVISLWSTSAHALAADDCELPVETSFGKVAGTGEDQTCVWRGVPFAAAPVGDLRWKAPAAHAGWAGVREATEFGAVCMQAGAGTSFQAGAGAVQSEDCLFLNVWRPARSGEFPVMVWIHGGGYAGGSGSSSLYNGSRLADFGEVVVVTINYRLGSFGFLAHPGFKAEDPNGAVGGYGILDMVAALEWVHDNVGNFGGDPGAVTIFGESAGAWAVCNLMASPLGKGLFHKAIMESQGCEASATLEEGYQQAAAISNALGCGADDVACLRAVPAKKLMKAASENVDGLWNLLPNPDGYLMTDTPLAMIKAGNYNRVPLLAGHNRNEADLLTYFMPKLYAARPAGYEKIRLKSIPLTDEEAKELVGLYPLADYEGKVRKAYGQIVSDALVSCPTYSAVSAVAAQQPEVYYYRFDYDQMQSGKRIGAAHAMEMAFVFNTFDLPPIDDLYGKKRMPDALALSRVIQGYWVNFAKTGDPNGAGLPQWRPWSSAAPNRMILDVEPGADRSDYDAKCEFWESCSQRHALPAKNLGK